MVYAQQGGLVSSQSAALSLQLSKRVLRRGRVEWGTGTTGLLWGDDEGRAHGLVSYFPFLAKWLVVPLAGLGWAGLPRWALVAFGPMY